MADFQNKFDQKIWDVVAKIKAGQVMSYGKVARSAGFPRHARMVSKDCYEQKFHCHGIKLYVLIVV